MKRACQAGLMIAALLAADAAAKTDLVAEWTFFSGQTFLDLQSRYPTPQGIDQLYVAGLSDALNAHHSPDQDWIYKCSRNRQTSQLTAIFRKWLEGHPERLHQSAASLYLAALREACVKAR